MPLSFFVAPFLATILSTTLEHALICRTYCLYWKDSQFQRVQKAEKNQAEQAFVESFKWLWSGQSFNKLTWESLNYAYSETKHFLLLHQTEGNQTGRGLFIFRKNPRFFNVVLVPHVHDEWHTGEIGLKTFLYGPYAAFASTTYFRALSRSKAFDKKHQLSMAYLQSFVHGFCKNFRQAYCLQIHGFSLSKHPSEAKAHTKVIVSSASNPPSLRAEKLALYLKIFFRNVLIFPKETQAFGGANVYLSIFKCFHHAGFLHLEYSLPFRKQLLTSPFLFLEWLWALWLLES